MKNLYCIQQKDGYKMNGRHIFDKLNTPPSTKIENVADQQSPDEQFKLDLKQFFKDKTEISDTLAKISQDKDTDVQFKGYCRLMQESLKKMGDLKPTTTKDSIFQRVVGTGKGGPTGSFEKKVPETGMVTCAEYSKDLKRYKNIIYFIQKAAELTKGKTPEDQEVILSMVPHKFIMDGLLHFYDTNALPQYTSYFQIVSKRFLDAPFVKKRLIVTQIGRFVGNFNTSEFNLDRIIGLVRITENILEPRN